MRVTSGTVRAASLFAALLLLLASCANMAAAPLQPRGNAAQALASAGTFKRFLAMAKAAGMMPALAGKGPITVFAPTDAAFARLPRGTLRRFRLRGGKDGLKALVGNHVVAATVTPGEAANRRRELRTLAGRLVVLNGLNPKRGIFYGNAKVTKPSLEAANGAVHAIDRVVLP